MSLLRETSAGRPIAVNDPIPTLLRDLVHERTGVYFESGRLGTMLEKLEPRATALRCQSYLDYYYILKYDTKADAEWRRVMDAVSVQETYFWREHDQIRALVERIVPEWFKHRKEPLRIWSAACASGEEPYSIAMALCEGGWGDHPIEIIASDASEAALARARAAAFRTRSFRALPAALKEKYFESRGEEQVLSAEIIERVNFRWANLMEIEDLPEASGLQVIFCRNVFIYFSTDAIKRVVGSFATSLPVNGKLFIGASESLLKLTGKFDLQEMAGAFIYVRNGEPSSAAIS